jgi:hypothetical protein
MPATAGDLSLQCEACDEALAADEDVYEADSGFYHIACRQNVPHMLP